MNRIIKTLAVAIFCGASIYSYAQITVTSSVYTGTIAYLADEGKVIKKGEPLIKFDTSTIDAQIKEAECDIELAKEEYYNRCLDKERSTKITGVISRADREDIDTSCVSSKISWEKSKHALDVLKTTRDTYLINAPYDCKVVKQLAIVNAGTDIGQPVLEIEKIM